MCIRDRNITSSVTGKKHTAAEYCARIAGILAGLSLSRSSTFYVLSIIQTLVSQGYITGELKDSFPAANIVDPDNFISLLYYFGMLTISGMHKGKNKLTIPNQVVDITNPASSMITNSFINMFS